jgi:type 1 fimbria pilin
MDIKSFLLRGIIFLSCSIFSTAVLAFSCTTNGQNLGSGSSWSVPVAPPVLKKDTQSYVTITDMASYVTCNGTTGDNLKTLTASINSTLASYGFTGVININGTRYDMPASGYYIWPYPLSSATLNGTTALKVVLELKRATKGAWKTGVTLPAGTTIATFVAQQRSGSSWGWNDTWTFKLNADLVIPAYTCNVTSEANRSVKLPRVNKSDLQSNGSGRYNGSKTQFSFNLDCDELATVKVSFSGPRMTGKNDVLANQESGNDNVGVQVVPSGSSTAVKFDGSSTNVIDSALAQETLDFDAYYYYNGGSVSGGPVRALATYTFDYE